MGVMESPIVSIREDDDDEPFVPAPLSWFDDPPNQHDEPLAAAAEESSSAENVLSPTVTSPSPRKSPGICFDEDVDDDQNEQPLAHDLLQTSIGAPLPSPSWKEISSSVLPSAAKELLSSSLTRIAYTARFCYAASRWQRKYSEIGNLAGGYYRTTSTSDGLPVSLPPFSSLPWVDRQMVKEWRTYQPDDDMAASEDAEQAEFERARTLVPQPAARPRWQRLEHCHACRKPFGPTRLRHHCRLCGRSYCHAHSSATHALPHIGYEPDVPERVCDGCKALLLEQNLAERVAWRLARCRDYRDEILAPYFEIGVDTVEEAAMRVTQAALSMARSIPLGAQATVAVETVDVLRKYGLNGIYTIMLRQEFLAAADLLRKALGINRTAWPLSVHELTAAIFYALAQHRAMRGMYPDREHLIHSFKRPSAAVSTECEAVVVDEQAAIYETESADIAGLVSSGKPLEGSSHSSRDEQLPFQPVCEPLPDSTLASLIFYAPMALNFIYAEKQVDMQLLAAQQGWRLLYAHLDQSMEHKVATDRPASALFVHEQQKIACLAVRGTTTIHDVITDIRQVPVPFPDTDTKTDDDWTTVFSGHGVAVCGMAAAAVNLYREHIDSVLFFAKLGYRIRLTGHSLGGGVATLLGALVYRDLERLGPARGLEGTLEGVARLKVYAFGTPSCVDAKLAEDVDSFVTTVVLHDDVIPRLTPSSCRGLLKHLLHIRETWVKAHLPGDLMAIRDRAKTAWAPRWRGSFTISKSSSTIKRYCRKQLQYGKKKLIEVKDRIVGDEGVDSSHCCGGRSYGLSSIEEATDEFSFAGQDTHKDAATTNDSPVTDDDDAKPVLDYMGGMDNREEGVVIDGDEFFDTEESLLEESESESEDGLAHDEIVIADRDSSKNAMPSDTELETTEEEEAPGAVVVEDTPLPRMFIPGKVVHIYSHRGVYRAAYVPRTFRELRRISLAANMLSDHKTKEYYEALLELHTVRQAPEDPPKWTAFDEDDTCRFTWASTSDSAAQEARDKHHCRSCGTLVCDPCSKNRIPLPSIGLSVASRVCDRCYNDIAGMLTTPGAMTNSFLVDEGEEKKMPGDSKGRPERERERRSAVVDELASRVQASALKCS